MLHINGEGCKIQCVFSLRLNYIKYINLVEKTKNKNTNKKLQNPTLYLFRIYNIELLCIVCYSAKIT